MFGVWPDSKCISLKYRRCHLPDMEENWNNYKWPHSDAWYNKNTSGRWRRVLVFLCFSFVIKYAVQQRSPEVSKMALSLKSNVAVAHPTTSGWSHISRVYIRWVFCSGSLFHLNWIVFNATVFLCIWTQSELGFSSEGAAAAMMANLLKSATKWSRSPLIPDTGRRTQIFWLRSAM